MKFACVTDRSGSLLSSRKRPVLATTVQSDFPRHCAATNRVASLWLSKATLLVCTSQLRLGVRTLEKFALTYAIFPVVHVSLQLVPCAMLMHTGVSEARVVGVVVGVVAIDGIGALVGVGVAAVAVDAVGVVTMVVPIVPTAVTLFFVPVVAVLAVLAWVATEVDVSDVPLITWLALSSVIDDEPASHVR